MQRRDFLTVPAALAAVQLRTLADTPMPMITLGKSGLKISRYGVGGYHMAVKGEEEAVRIIHRAMDLGVTFFDSAFLYHNGKSDEIYGRALAGGRRQKVILMSKAEKYSKAEAMQQLETQLQRMKTDYLDLWQCHQVSEHKEVDQIFAPSGALEAFVLAKKQGKVRHIGFTGHRDPGVHKRLLEGTSEWETVQMPINCVDPHYRSFITEILPLARRKGLGVIAMKSNAMGALTQQKVATIEECLRFTWSQDIDALVSGAETVAQLEQNLLVLKTLKKMPPAEQQQLLTRTGQGPKGVQVERYKRPPENARNLASHRDGEA